MSALAASRDGRWIAIGLHDGEILLWKRGVAKPRELAGHGRRIQSLKFNPDGSLLVSAGSDGEVRLWQAEGGESTLLGKHNTGVAAVAFDGHRVASGDAKGLIRLWSVDGQPLGEVSGSVSVSSLALANEQVVAGLGDGTVRLADTSTGQIVREWRAASGSIRCLLVAGETSEVITGSLTGSAARWDIATGRLLHTFAEPGHPGFRSFDLSPDERLIAAGDRDGDITVWDRLTGERVGRLAGRTGPIEGVGFVGSSTEVASASWNGAARGWTIGFGHAQRHFVSDVGRPVRLWFESGDAVVAAVSSSGRVGRWNSATGERIDSWDLGGSAALSVAPNERFAAFAVDDQIVHVVDLSKRTLAASVPTSERAIATAVAGDGNHVAYGCESGLVEIRVCEDGRGRHTSAAAAGCTALAASPDGCFIAAGFRDGSARIFDLRQRQVRVIGLDAWSSPVLAISFSPDSRVIAFGLHENSVATLHLVHAETGVVFRSCGGGGAGVDTLTFSPTGRRLASSGERRSLRVWGVDDGQEILVLQGLDSQISALAFSRDGLSLAASTGAGSVNVYSGSMPQWWWIQAATDR
jgi:WD40 repeat protein